MKFFKKKLFIEVIPNCFNKSNATFIIYKGFHDLLRWEIGRVTSQEELDCFVRTYIQTDGQVIDL